MPVEEALVQRVRERLGGAAVTERRMFGGAVFLTGGHMAVGVLGGDLLVRVGPSAQEEALTRPGTRRFDLTGRPMPSWVVVDGAVLDDDALAAWLGLAAAFVRTLPAR